MCKQTFPGHESDINAVTVSPLDFHSNPLPLIFLPKRNKKAKVLICVFFLLFSSFRTVMPSRLVATTRRCGCLTFERIKSWPCTRTTTSSAASPQSHSQSPDDYSWQDTTTSTATSGTAYGRREQVKKDKLIIYAPGTDAQDMLETVPPLI